jgi:hypothetical protein
VCLDITTRLFNGFPLFAVYPLRFHRRYQSRSPRTPSCAMWFSGESTPLPTHSQLDRSQEIPLNPHRRLVRQTRFYHILHQVVPIYVHGCTIFMGGRSMNWSLDLGMMSTTGFWSPPDKPRTVGIHRTQFQTHHPKSLFFTLRGNNND